MIIASSSNTAAVAVEVAARGIVLVKHEIWVKDGIGSRKSGVRLVYMMSGIGCCNVDGYRGDLLLFLGCEFRLKKLLEARL